MKKSVLFTGCLLVVIAGCQPAKENSVENEQVVNIRTAHVAYTEYKIPVRATGMLASQTEIKLSFKTGGLIKDIYVREGDLVRKGELLASLDLSEIRARVNQATAGVEKVNRDLTRARNLYNDSVVTLEQYQNAQSARDVALADMQIAQFNLQHSQIRAPQDGKIQKLLIETNEMIAPGYPAILFASAENAWVVKVAVTDKDIVKIAPGDSVTITMDAFPGQTMQAEVSELGAMADPVTGTYAAELLLKETMPQFRSGFIARAEIFPAITERSLKVPLHALLEAHDSSAQLYLYEDGRAVKRVVRTGKIIGNDIVILDGLKEGDQVVTDGLTYLGKETQVKLLPEQKTE